jgi:uncharacterized integral membrane protein
MSLNSEVRLVAKPAAAKMPFIAQILIAILSGALLAAATAEALEMLHH